MSFCLACIHMPLPAGSVPVQGRIAVAFAGLSQEAGLLVHPLHVSCQNGCYQGCPTSFCFFGSPATASITTGRMLRTARLHHHTTRVCKASTLCKNSQCFSVCLASAFSVLANLKAGQLPADGVRRNTSCIVCLWHDLQLLAQQKVSWQPWGSGNLLVPNCCVYNGLSNPVKMRYLESHSVW